MSDFFVGLGLFFVIEGLVYALAPSVIRRAAERLPNVGDGPLRVAGAVAVAIGVGIVWLVRR